MEHKPEFINNTVNEYLERLQKRCEGLEITLDAVIKLCSVAVTEENKGEVDNLRNVLQHFLVRDRINYKAFN